jgi:hypothetical protein
VTFPLSLVSVYRIKISLSFSVNEEKQRNILIKTILFETFANIGVRGGAVVEALHYKPAGHWIDSRWCHLNFSFT